MLFTNIRNQKIFYRYIALTFYFLIISQGANGKTINSESAEPLDYATLSHEISIDMLRAGTESGVKKNDYIFIVTGNGLIDSPEEKSLDFVKRKKVTIELGRFGETKIDALAIWRADDKAKEFKQLRIDGKAIRDLVAKSMSELVITEDGVIIQIDVSMIAKKKKYFLLPDERVIAVISYLPLKDIASAEAQKSFVLTDDKGVHVKLSLRYPKEGKKKERETTNNSN